MNVLYTKPILCHVWSQISINERKNTLYYSSTLNWPYSPLPAVLRGYHECDANAQHSLTFAKHHIMKLRSKMMNGKAFFGNGKKLHLIKDDRGRFLKHIDYSMGQDAQRSVYLLGNDLDRPIQGSICHNLDKLVSPLRPLSIIES